MASLAPLPPRASLRPRLSPCLSPTPSRGKYLVFENGLILGASMTNFGYRVIGTGRLVQSRKHVWLTMPIPFPPFSAQYSPNIFQTITEHSPNIPQISPKYSPLNPPVSLR